MELIQELNQKVNELNISVRQLRVSGTAKAEAEKNYKIALRMATLKLRDAGYPVGIIDKLVYGEKEIAELRFKRDVAETVYTANLEAINSIKLQMRLIESQISREWESAK